MDQLPENPDGATRRQPDSLVRRLRDWLTPPNSLRALGRIAEILPGARLDVFQIDSSTRQLLDPVCRRYAFQVLRERGFPNRELSLGPGDMQVLVEQRALVLNPLATMRWLAAADRPLKETAFGFLFQPFTLSVDGDCLISGRVVPALSRARLPCARLQPSVHAQQLLLGSREADAGAQEDSLERCLRALCA